MIKPIILLLIIISATSCLNSKDTLVLKNDFEKDLEIKFYFQKEERLKVKLPANDKIIKSYRYYGANKLYTMFDVSCDSIVYLYEDGKSFYQACGGKPFGFISADRCFVEKDLYDFASGKFNSNNLGNTSRTITLDKTDYAKAK